VAILKRQRTRFEGADVFVIRQPDGTLAHVPCWMMRETAAHHALCAAPVLPLAHLRDLRGEIDALLDFLRSDSTTEKMNNEPHRDPPPKRSVRRGGAANGPVVVSEEPDAAADPGNADGCLRGDNHRGGDL
jgi:hypothetical protein